MRGWRWKSWRCSAPPGSRGTTERSTTEPTRKEVASSPWRDRPSCGWRIVDRVRHESIDRQGGRSMYRVERIEPSKTAMIVVDMQNDFVAPGAPMQSPAGLAMVPRLKQALTCCRESGIPVIYTAHVHRPGGCDLG